MVRLMTQETELIFRTAAARADTKPAFPYTADRSAAGRRCAPVRLAHRRAPPNRAPDIGGTWVLYLHGNASTVASRMNVKHCTRLRELGLNVLAPEYRGYNGLAGHAVRGTVSQPTRGPRTTTSATSARVRRIVS